MNNNGVTAIFRQHIQSSADGLIYAIEQIPTGRLFITPHPAFGAWSAARILFHVTYYERQLVLPQMKIWLHNNTLTLEQLEAQWEQEEQVWRAAGSKQNLSSLLTDFRAVRDDQLQLIDLVRESLWAEVKDTVWGQVSLRWVMVKTYQHTLEYTDTLLKMALNWDMTLMAEKAARNGGGA